MKLSTSTNQILIYIEKQEIFNICCWFLLDNALLLPIILLKTIINHLLSFLKDFVKFRIMITNHSLQIYNFLHLPAYNLQVKLTKRKPTNLQLSHFESCRFYNGKHTKSTAYKVWPPPPLKCMGRLLESSVKAGKPNTLYSVISQNVDIKIIWSEVSVNYRWHRWYSSYVRYGYR